MADITKKRKSFLVDVAFWAVIGAIYFVFFKYVVPATWPFVIAFLITLLLKGPINKLSEKLHMPRKGAAAIVLILFHIIIAALLVLVVFYTIYALINWISTLPDLYTNEIQPALSSVLNWVENLFTRLDPSYQAFLDGLGDNLLSAVSEIITALSKTLLSAAQKVVFAFPSIIIGVMFTIIATVFITLDYPNIRAFVLGQFSQKNVGIILDIRDCLKYSVVEVLKSYAVIMCITFIELSISLSIIKIPHSILIALLTAMIDIVPILGTGTIMIPWSIIQLINGNFAMGGKLALIYIIITVIRNYIEPRIVGKGLGVNSIILLLCMYVGAKLLGAIGIVVLPFTIVVLKDLNEKGKIKLFNSDYEQEQGEEHENHTHASANNPHSSGEKNE